MRCGRPPPRCSQHKLRRRPGRSIARRLELLCNIEGRRRLAIAADKIGAGAKLLQRAAGWQRGNVAKRGGIAACGREPVGEGLVALRARRRLHFRAAIEHLALFGPECTEQLRAATMTADGCQEQRGAVCGALVINVGAVLTELWSGPVRDGGEQSCVGRGDQSGMGARGWVVRAWGWG